MPSKNISAKPAIAGHRDIRIGTLASTGTAPKFIRETIGHGFESYGLSFWQKIGDVDIRKTAEQVKESVGDRAVISCVGLFGNILEDETARKDFATVIDTAHLFGVDLVTGFSGAVTGKPVPENMPRFKEVWSELVRRAEGAGVRIAFENCDMGGWWHGTQWNVAHSPTAWEMIFDAIPSDALGLQWEPCHQMNSLIDPLPQLRKWVPKIFHVHGKDATIAWDIIKTYGLRGGKQYVWHRTPGFGDTNWTDVISILRMAGWSGSIDIEGYHDPVYRDDLEMTGQVHGLNYLKSCRGGPFITNPSK